MKRPRSVVRRTAQAGRSRSIADRFLAALRTPNDADTAHPELLPTRLAQACVQVLPVDAAGIAVISDAFRVPIGASDEYAIAAERLQFTVGDGPCLQAIAQRQPIVATRDVIAARWPVFHTELTARSPYRSIVAIPLQLAPHTPGALDLYFRDPNLADTVDLGAAAAVAARISTVLSATATATTTVPPRWPGIPLPDWMYSPQARNRLRTWIAAGVLMAHYGATPTDALDRLRAHAYAHDELLDDVAEDVILGTITVQQLAL